MRRLGWSVVCGSCVAGHHMCGGDCDCDNLDCLKARGFDLETKIDRFPASQAPADSVGLLIEGHCPVHGTELRQELDGRGYCDTCAAEMGVVCVGYRVQAREAP